MNLNLTKGALILESSHTLEIVLACKVLLDWNLDRGVELNSYNGWI